MIPSGNVNPILPEKKVDVSLHPELIQCCEKRCKEIPIIAFWPHKTKQFKFACQIHKFVADSVSCVAVDNMEDYRKKVKRKIYYQHFQEFLK